jgi:hypothetical protein
MNDFWDLFQTFHERYEEKYRWPCLWHCELYGNGKGAWHDAAGDHVATFYSLDEAMNLLRVFAKERHNIEV